MAKDTRSATGRRLIREQQAWFVSSERLHRETGAYNTPSEFASYQDRLQVRPTPVDLFRPAR